LKWRPSRSTACLSATGRLTQCLTWLPPAPLPGVSPAAKSRLQGRLLADGHVWVPHRGSSLQAPEEAAIYSWLTPHNAWLRSAREARGYFGTCLTVCGPTNYLVRTSAGSCAVQLCAEAHRSRSVCVRGDAPRLARRGLWAPRGGGLPQLPPGKRHRSCPGFGWAPGSRGRRAPAGAATCGTLPCLVGHSSQRLCVALAMATLNRAQRIPCSRQGRPGSGTTAAFQRECDALRETSFARSAADPFFSVRAFPHLCTPR